MMDNEPLTPTEYNTCRGVINAFLIVLLIGAVLLAAFVVTRASAAADWLCDYVEALTVYENVHVAEWLGYPDGWADMPADLGHDIMLPISEDSEQFYLLKSSAGAGETWLWTYRSTRTWTDQAGDWDGHHDFCPAVLRIKQ